MRLGLEAMALTDLEGGGVRVDVRGDGVETSLTARWVIAADGAKSTVRSLRGIAMIDQGFDQTWLVVDTMLRDPDLPLPRVARQHCSPDRVCTFVPGPGLHRRWEFQLRPDEQREDVLAPESIAQLLSQWGSPDQIEVTRAAVYRFHANVAATFRDGPVFLTGDAAHQMPPFNGQGMCTGMRDAENLSWKLAAVWSGQLDDAALDTYDEERRPHAADQVAHAVDAGMLNQAIAHDGAAALESGYGQRPFPKLTGSAFAGDHPSVGVVFPAAGDDPVPFGDGWRVLRAGAAGDVPALWHDLGAEITADAADSYPGLLGDGGVVVVRPDRYVAAVATDLADVTAQLSIALAQAEEPT
jgi:3-(3-hydroxy-phenyl)propionate hydroxylase